MAGRRIELPDAATESMYFDYICSLVMHTEESRGYKFLLSELHNIEFYSIVDFDDNRAAYGLLLRERFANDMTGIDPRILLEDLAKKNKPCSFLEMLVALALDCEDKIMYGWFDNEDHTDHWFWQFIYNLGLQWCTDKEAELSRAAAEDISSFIHHRIAVVLERTYDPDGFGGIFPLKHPCGDQRKVELWYQLNSWILENYVNGDAWNGDK